MRLQSNTGVPGDCQVGQVVRPKKGSYTPALRDCNQIQRIQTTGLGVLTRKPCIYETTKQKNLHVITFWNPSGMSMNDTKNENSRDGNPNFIYN